MDNKIEWIIPNFRQYFLSEKTTQLRLLTSEEVKKEDHRSDKPGLDFKIQFSGFKNNICDIFFLCHNFDTVTYKLSIYLGNHNERFQGIKETVRVQATKENFQIQRNKWQYITTLYEKEAKSKVLLCDGSLKLRFEYKFQTVINNYPHVLDCDNQLCNEFKRLLSEAQFSDIVIIKSVEGNEYKVHKAVLTYKSEVMKAHFEHNMIEKQTNIMESGLEDEVLKDILTYFYCNKAPSLKDMPEKLLAAADYYQLSQLKVLCEETLCKNLSVENAIDTLLLAELYTASILKESTLEFMKDEAPLIIRTKGWETLNSPEVLKAFCDNILDSNVESIKPYIQPKLNVYDDVDYEEYT